MMLRELILEKLEELGEAAVGSFFPAKYPEARFWRSLLGSPPSRRFSRRSFSALLSQLRAQGLVRRLGTNRKATWKITSRGNTYLRDQKRQKPVEPKRDGIQRLVIFDIPEKEKPKREAIRRKLITIGYTRLQKSVWVGEFPLPTDFVGFVDALNLGERVHIFSIREQGTVRRHTEEESDC